MRSLFLAAFAVLLAGCASGPAEWSGGEDPAVTRGRNFAERRCAGCHAVGLDEGLATSGPRFRDLNARYSALSLRRRFAEISEHGSGEMPPVEIDPATAQDLLAYLESIRRP